MIYQYHSIDYRIFASVGIGDFSADLHRWDENTLAWTNITLAAQAGGSVPPAREHHGFVATGDGRLYVHGGLGYGGKSVAIFRPPDMLFPYLAAKLRG